MGNYERIHDKRFGMGPRHSEIYLDQLLADLLSKASNMMKRGEYPCFAEEYYPYEEEKAKSYRKFVKSIHSIIKNKPDGSVNYVTGRAGTGKTLFFREGIKELFGGKTYHRLLMDFEDVQPNRSLEYYRKLCLDFLRDNAMDEIRYLGADVFRDFDRKFGDFCGSHTETRETDNAHLFPVKYLCECVYAKEGMPLIILFDNVDLLPMESQLFIFTAACDACSKLLRFVERENMQRYYRIFIIVRPEAPLREKRDPGERIVFPLPNIVRICKEVLRCSLFKAAEELDGEMDKENQDWHIKVPSIVDQEKTDLNSPQAVADYIASVVDHFIDNEWSRNEIIERLDTSERFHNEIVNSNVRAFLAFFSETLEKGGFYPLTHEAHHELADVHFSVFDYVEMVIRGCYDYHPGNKHFDGEFRRFPSLLIFNLFEAYDWDYNEVVMEQHFMLYIRILQFINFHADKKVSYATLTNVLSSFFDPTFIAIATKRLIHAKMIYSFKDGEKRAEAKTEWHQVTVDDATLLSSSNGAYYLKYLICEFEYLYQIAITAPMEKEKAAEMRDKYRKEKERVVLYFLESVYEIIKENIAFYQKKSDGSMDAFRRNFCNDGDGAEFIQRPFRRMLKSYIAVLEKKRKSTWRYEDEERKAERERELKHLLAQARKLRDESNAFFSETLTEM
ncbi:MAG: hypothetical protein FWC27_04470 [Firmicutes bacterium]|nr:hypothetical protein [Bacillota bacterium]